VERTSEKGSGIPRTPFKLAQKTSEPTSFDLQFVANERLYRLGIKIDDERVLEEWLLVYSGSKEKVLYERSIKSGAVVIDIQDPLLEGAGEKLKPLAKVGGPANQTFLATVAANLDKVEYGNHLRAVFQWFDQLTLISPHHHFGQLPTALLVDSELKTFASDFLRNCSTGVDAITARKTPLTESELRSLFPAEVAPKFLEHLKAGSHISGPGLSEIVADGEKENEFYRITVQTDHTNVSGQPVTFKLDEESDGTKRLIDLLPALYYLQTTEAVYFIDEIDRSLHPILIRHFMEHFLNSCSGCRRQIIVTTHESNLLDLDLLRRDEIWFAEKDSGGATQLYSLAEFKVRNDLKLQKNYLAGRFGAIPFLGNIEALGRDEGACFGDSEGASSADA
jgi:hypothetical protein